MRIVLLHCLSTRIISKEISVSCELFCFFFLVLFVKDIFNGLPARKRAGQGGKAALRAQTPEQK